MDNAQHSQSTEIVSPQAFNGVTEARWVFDKRSFWLGGGAAVIAGFLSLFTFQYLTPKPAKPDEINYMWRLSALQLNIYGRELLSLDYRDVPADRRSALHEELIGRLAASYQIDSTPFVPVHFEGLESDSHSFSIKLRKRADRAAVIFGHQFGPKPFATDDATVRWLAWIGHPETGNTLLQAGDERFEDFVDRVLAPALTQRINELISEGGRAHATAPLSYIGKVRFKVAGKKVEASPQTQPSAE